MIRRHLLVHGRVQGVSFRAATQQQAREHAVAGWVANLADGTVEVELEGEPDDVEAVIGWCHQGPPAAGVSRVDVTEIEPTGASEFSVR
jgi:acylphosphatase